MVETLVVNEIYLSLQGESTLAGLPCVFVRLTACNLRCSYCDTAYAFTEGRKMPLNDVRQEVLRLAARFENPGPTDEKSPPSPRPSPPGEGGSAAVAGGVRLPIVELTGGEPLLQPNSLPLMKNQ